MKTTTSKGLSEAHDGKHSFLFWLIVPIIMIWLAVSYIIGFVKDRPAWEQMSNRTVQSASVNPYLPVYPPLPASPDGSYVSLWFDDAWLSQYMTAYPILKSYGYPATVAVPAAAVETPGYMNWAQLRVLQSDGWEMANHSMVHDCTMNSWEKDKVENEYQAAKLMLWKNKLASDIFVTPCGVDSPVMRDAATKLFVGYRTVDPGINDLANPDFYNLKVRNLDFDVTVETVQGWIDNARKEHGWVILVFHKVGEPGKSGDTDQYNTRTEDLTTILDYIKSLNIPVVVPNQVLTSVIP